MMNDCITTTKQSTTQPCAYFLGNTVDHVTQTTIRTNDQLQSITNVKWLPYLGEKQVTQIIIAVNYKIDQSRWLI